MSDKNNPVENRTNSHIRTLFSRLFSIPVLLCLVLVDSAYLAIANRASGPPRIPISAITYEGCLLMHLGLSFALGYQLLRASRSIAAKIKEMAAAPRFTANIALLTARLCLLTGIGFLGIGFRWLPLGVRPGLRLAHDTFTVLFLVFAAITVILRARAAAAANSPEKRQARLVLKTGVAFAVPFVALIAYTVYAPNTDRIIINPALPPITPMDEGDGSKGKFFPANVQSVDQQFFPSEYFMDSKSCGKVGCHPDIYKQWESSSHHRSSFNNQWYRKAIEYMQEVAGPQPSKWCGGCHDMAVLLTEDPKNKGKSRFDVPILAHEFPAQQFPESHSGIGCAACHSVVHVKSTMGTNDYTSDYPPMHKFIAAENPITKSMQEFLTRLAPEPHKKTFLRPFHTNQTAKFCSSCHKVHLDIPVNNYRWFRGFNDYDSWQQSGVSGFGAASFYYPMDDKGQPAFKKCADCHMPNTKSQDAGAVNGMVHNHRFPGANTALPTAYHDKEQMEATEKFMKDKAVSVDIFAIRRQKGAEKLPAKPANTPGAASDTPQAANLNGDDTGTHIAAANNASTKEETIAAPINRGGPGAVLHRGEAPLVDVVVRTLKLGHAFPAGTIDAADVWLELEVKDNLGKEIYHSGKLQWENGPEEPGSEQYRAVQIDGHSNPINKRNAWAARAVVYAKVIGPGAADTVHFRIPVPQNCGNSVTLTAKLNYRKFNWFNNQFAYLGRFDETAAPTTDTSRIKVKLGYNTDGSVKSSGPVSHGWDDRAPHFDADLSKVSGDLKDVPVLPITVLAQDVVTLPVIDGNASVPGPLPLAPTTEDTVKKDRVRWNDYGIGLMLQGDFRHATAAFEQVTKAAPKWPEGYVNIGRVRQAERDTPAAKAAFEKAFTLYDAAPTPMTKYQKARTQNFYAQTLFDTGRLDDSLNMFRQAMEVFPEDRNLHNSAGIILFRLGRYDDAMKELKQTLAIDPEDITAHYNLMKCCRAKGDFANAEIHAKLYKRFKVDETTTNLVGPFVRTHPYDNNLAQPIHEHADAVCLPKPAWLVKREAEAAAKQRAAARIARPVPITTSVNLNR